MSKETAALLEAFEALPAGDKRAFTAELLKRTLPFDSGPLEDVEVAHTGRDLFIMLDRANEESNPR